MKHLKFDTLLRSVIIFGLIAITVVLVRHALVYGFHYMLDFNTAN